MLNLAQIPPKRRRELLIREVDDHGQTVVKDPRSGGYYELGEAEAFLLQRLDGRRGIWSLRVEFEKRFGEPLTHDDVDDFIELARTNDFLETQRNARNASGSDPPAAGARQSILYWRKSAFDPDALLNWLEPKIRLVWTRGFVVASSLLIAMALGVAWSNRAELISHFPHLMRWETWMLVWLTLALVTTLHEFAHGLTCKRFGGEVHEIGFLLMFFIPCFYCNVSDAWLFREKSRRLWVTFAGAYCDLVLWALAVLFWRLTATDALANYLAWIVLSVCGVRVFFNFNPLLKLDGYYLLSDAVAMPNLRQRSLDAVAARLRWILWGADRPAAQERRFLLIFFGVAVWAYAFSFLCWLTLMLVRYTDARWGAGAAVGAGILGCTLLKGLFSGISNGEVMTMIRTRWWRTAGWIVGLGLGGIACAMVPVTRRASGPFQIRSTVRAEVRAPVPAFVRDVRVDEGDRVEPGQAVARLDVVDLASRIAQKQAELEECSAKLRLLEAGPRAEEVVEERRRVQRASEWHELAKRDLETSRRALSDELRQLEEQIHQSGTELGFAREGLARAKQLFESAAMAPQEYSDWERKTKVAASLLEQHEAERRARQTMGTTVAEAEVARRERDLADARMTLALLEAGARPEEIQAQQAHLARVREELSYLKTVESRLELRAPAGGTISTPRLRERAAQYLKEGDLFCLIEGTNALEVEIALPEDESAPVSAGQRVEFKALASPYKTFRGTVERVAPAAVAGTLRSTVTVYCSLEGSPELRPGMTGHARIGCGKWSLGRALSDKAMKVVRTEFWW